MTDAGLNARCCSIADRIVPEYRDGKARYSCSGHTAKRWQAAYDGAAAALRAPVEAAREAGPGGRIAEVIADGDGFWRTCSGCCECEDGYPDGDYSHSEAFGCTVGGGCGDCGGLGVLWDDTDYDDYARWSLSRDRFDRAFRAGFEGRLLPNAGALASEDRP